MPRTEKGSVTVQKLITLLDNPRENSNRRYKQHNIDRDQVKKSMKFQWKDPGFCSVQFSKAPCIRPKILNEWQVERINMAVRSYKAPKHARPYRFDKESRELPKVTTKHYPTKFQQYLSKVEADAEDLQFKQKRTLTQGIRSLNSTITHKQNVKFRPVTTTSKLFGFSVAAKEVKRYSNPNINTIAH